MWNPWGQPNWKTSSTSGPFIFGLFWGFERFILPEDPAGSSMRMEEKK
jgi:hypothetical protein